MRGAGIRSDLIDHEVSRAADVEQKDWADVGSGDDEVSVTADRRAPGQSCQKLAVVTPLFTNLVAICCRATTYQSA